MAPTVGPRATEPDLGVLLCSIAISLIPRYLLGEGPLLKEGWCLGQCSAGNPQVLPSMRVLFWHVPKLCCRPCWQFKGNIIPWCPWPLSAGPQITPKNQTRSDRIMYLDDFWSIRKMSSNCPRSTFCLSGWGWLHLQRQTVRTNFKNLFMLVIHGLFSYFGLCSHLHDFHCGLFELGSPACCCCTSHPDRSHLINFINLALTGNEANTSFRSLIQANVYKWCHINDPFIILVCSDYSAPILGASFCVTMKLNTTACHFASCNEHAMKLAQRSRFNQTVITLLKNWNVVTVISLFINNFMYSSRAQM